MKGLEPEEKGKIIAAKDHQYVYVYRNKNNELASQLIDNNSKDEQNIHKLERKLLYYKENKEKILSQKMEEFRVKKVREEQDRRKMADAGMVKNVEVKGVGDGGQDSNRKIL